MDKRIKYLWTWSLTALFACPVVSAQTLDSIPPPDTISTVDGVETVNFQPSTLADADLQFNSEDLPSNTVQVATPDTVPKSTNAVDAPIHYAAKDSIVMKMRGQNMIFMYGGASVQYKNMNLTGERIEVDANNNAVYATFALDSIGDEFGYPVFKDGEMQYEAEKMRYNFKTKKAYISGVITQQGDGYMTARQTKKMANDDLFTKNARYSTCDNHECPHFYLNLTRAKLRPGKDVVTGPAYLVVEDVPLPVALPFAFFPFTKDYSSGIIMPTYGDELKRGFSLQNGGYYFALSDYMDLALTGEYFTRGSWGVNARSNYKKRYKFGGNFDAKYIVTIMGEKIKGIPDSLQDYSKTTNFRIAWTHTQDAKSNPFSTFSANVDFSTNTYNQSDLSTLYSPQANQNTTASNISYSYRPPGSVFSFSANASFNQIKRDTTLSVTLPTINITMREIYPFQRKERVGNLRWYENIRMSYTGTIANSIQNVKEYDFFNSLKNITRDWKNGIQHNIPISASFNLFKNISFTPSVNYTERWYFSKINRKYDYGQRKDVPSDTISAFYRIYNYNASASAQTTLYGTYKPLRIFGKWTEKTTIRHVMKPSVSFTGAPDFSDKKYGYYKDLVYSNEGRVDTLIYSPFAHNLWNVPGRGKSGTLGLSLDNNLEMKIPVADSTRKISLIDQFSLRTGYNFLAKEFRWSDLSATLRIKFPAALKNYTLTLSGIFDVYKYKYVEGNERERGRLVRVDDLRWKYWSIGRFRGTSQTVSFSLNNETFKKWFSKKDKESGDDLSNNETNQSETEETDARDRTNVPPRSSLRKTKEKDTNYDHDGYYLANIPWNINVNYSFGFSYDTDNSTEKKQEYLREHLEYPYKLTQNLGISGNISPAKNWSFTFNTGYDFDNKRFTPTQLSISRQMHCWSMSASVIPVGPYQSYSFTIAVNSSLLQDLKYNQSSNYRDAMNWGY